MFKKILILISCLILIITASGCNDKTNSNHNVDPNDFSFDFGEEQQSGEQNENDNQDSVDNNSSDNNSSAKGNNDSSSKKSNTSSKNNNSNGTLIDGYVTSSNITSSGGSTSSNNSSKVNCNHSYSAADCEQPEICKHCGKIGKSALGHKFVSGVCSVCNAKYLDWYINKDISITKSEVDQIISMQYKKPKNVIFMIGDGMGPNDIAYTEKTYSGVFDFGLILNQIKYTGYATTHSNNNKVTDSAASGTALATGHKTNNGYIGMSPQSEILKNITEIAREKGKKVGIVTNDDVIGATPAAFGVHVDSRASSGYIAKSFVSFAPDVLIGQGRSYFQGLNLSNFVLANEFSKFNDMLNTNISCTKPFFGFFEINNSKDKEAKNTLAYCTEIAINRLKKNAPNGFFLMVENTTCDAAGHAADINGKKVGVVTLDRAIVPVLKFMKDNPDTLLIITSDHDNGAITMSGEFTATGHTDANVRTFAIGYGAEYFHNKTIDNTDIAKFAINAVSN